VTPTAAALARRPGRERLGGFRSEAGVSSDSLWLKVSAPRTAGLPEVAAIAPASVPAATVAGIATLRIVAVRPVVEWFLVRTFMSFPFVGAGRRGFGERWG
jgi:hypothetical protein